MLRKGKPARRRGDGREKEERGDGAAAVTGVRTRGAAAKHALPPLISAALASIERYDETGDNDQMESLEAVAFEVAMLHSNMTSPPQPQHG